MDPQSYIFEEPLPPAPVAPPVYLTAGEVAALRQKREALRLEKANLEETLRALLIYQELVEINNKVKDVESELAAKETELRQAVVDLYLQTGSKQTPYGTARVSVRLCYRAEDAINWCAKGYLSGLTLKRDVFEKAARSMDLDFVSKSEDITAALKSDLSEYLPKP